MAEYGEVGGDSIFDMFADPKEKARKIKAEIYARGPVATTINANPLRDYEGGILDDDTASTQTNHIVSITGFGKDATTGKEYWIIRNSWGEYWGEMGFGKIALGKNMLGIEDHVAWVTPGEFTIQDVACSENGKVCGGEDQSHGVGDDNTIPAFVQKKPRTHKFVSMQYVDPSVHFMAKKEAARTNLRQE